MYDGGCTFQVTRYNPGLPNPSNDISFQGSAYDSVTNDTGEDNGATITATYIEYAGMDKSTRFDPTKINVNGLSQFTICFDAYITQSGYYNMIFSETTTGYSAKVCFAVDSFTPEIAWRDNGSGDTGSIKKVISSSDISINQWYSFCLLFDSPNVTLFINGVQSGTGSNFGNMTNSTEKFFFGGEGGDYSYSRIRNFKLFKSALSLAQIQSLVS